MDSDSNSWSSEEVNRLLVHALDEFEQSLVQGSRLSNNSNVSSNEQSRSTIVSARNEQRELSASTSRTSEDDNEVRSTARNSSESFYSQPSTSTNYQSAGSERNVQKRGYDGDSDSEITTKNGSKRLISECVDCGAPLPSGQSVCLLCAMFRQCRRCKRFLRRGRFATEDDDTCATCYRRTTSQVGGSYSTSLGGIFTSETIPLGANYRDMTTALRERGEEVRDILTENLRANRNLKFFIAADVDFERNLPEGVNRSTGRFISPPTILLNDFDIDEAVRGSIDIIQNRIDNYQSMGSGWVVREIKSITVHSVKYDMLGGSTFIPTPQRFRNRSLLNIRNTDDKCFTYSILAQIHPVGPQEHPERPSKYIPFQHEINMQDISYPVKISEIAKFENQNPDISVNVLYYDEDEKCIAPLYATKHFQRKHHANLFLLTSVNGRGEKISHYTLVRDLSTLLCHKSQHDGKSFVCMYCLHRFWEKRLLDSHLPECGVRDPCRIDFPKGIVRKKKSRVDEHETLEESLDIDKNLSRQDREYIIEKTLQYSSSADVDDLDSILKFTHYNRSHRVPFAIYADFECFITEKSADTEEHIPCGFCCLRVSAYSEFNDSSAFVYRGSNVMERFYEYLNEQRCFIEEIIDRCEPMHPLTPEEKKGFFSADVCFNCEEKLHTKYRHHDHVTGKYVGPACNRCNLQLKFRTSSSKWKINDYFIPILCHNSKYYDSHLILKYLRERDVNGKIDVLASNTEQFISFQFNNFRFLDSNQFIPGSLQALVDTLKKDDVGKFSYTRRHVKNEEQFQLLLRKGVYPYEYVNEPSRFEETRLPPKDKFFSKVSDADISDDDYLHAINVWNLCEIKNLGQYHDLYLKLDVLLLADIFENFRNFSLTNYRLDPLYFYTLPGLSFDACLRMTKVRLDLFTSPDQLLFIEKGIRGGVSTITKRFAEANNPYLPEGKYDPASEHTYIQYYDANNLYGWAMTQALPVGDFKFLESNEIEKLDILKIPDDSSVGYILEVDLEYPPELHDEHNQFPLAPEKLVVTEDMLSSKQKEQKKKLNIKPQGKISKLIPNLQNKREYVVHYRNLKYYIEKGLKVTKIHRVLSFQQSCWLAPYINFNTEKRKLAKSAEEKNHFKFLNNSLFGRTMMNLRKHQNIKLVTNKTAVQKLISKPNFDAFKILNDDLTMVKMKKSRIFWNKPSYLGMVILDLSKLHMVKFHYDVMRKRYGDRSQLLFSDTDSLTYLLRTNDVYHDIVEDNEHFDTSDFPLDHICYNPANCKVIGKFKDELTSHIGMQFVGLRAKMYSILLADDHHKRTAKGIKSTYISNHLTHEAYLNCLLNEEKSKATFHCIRSDNHTLKTVAITKDCLNVFDDKRYVLDDSSHETLAYGHYRIAEIQCHDSVFN